MCFLSLSFIVTFSAMDIRDGESTQSRSIFDAVFNGRWSSWSDPFISVKMLILPVFVRCYFFFKFSFPDCCWCFLSLAVYSHCTVQSVNPCTSISKWIWIAISVSISISMPLPIRPPPHCPITECSHCSLHDRCILEWNLILIYLSVVYAIPSLHIYCQLDCVSTLFCCSDAVMCHFRSWYR